jgi:hypothetical protein
MFSSHTHPKPITRPLGFGRLLLAAVVALAAALPLAQAAAASPPGPVVPTRIQVGAGNKFLVGHAVGVQIYACNATAGGFSWGLVAPRAELSNDKGKLIADHYAGPTWQARYGSRVVGQRVDGVTADATAIPWLLLSAASTASGPNGDKARPHHLHPEDRHDRRTSSSRLAVLRDDRGSPGGDPYTADYHFWKATGG